MDKLTVIVNAKEKTVEIDRKVMKLDDAFTGASLGENNPQGVQSIDLKYEGNFSENDSPIEIEEEKLRNTYTEKLFEEIDISGSMPGDGAHYISFYGNISPSIVGQPYSR